MKQKRIIFLIFIVIILVAVSCTENMDLSSEYKNGKVVIENTKKESDSIDEKQIKVANGEKIKIESEDPIIGWSDENTLLLGRYFEPEKLTEYDVKSKELKIVKPDILNKKVEVFCNSKEKVLMKDSKGEAVYLYDILKNSLKDLGNYKNAKNLVFADIDGKYVIVQCEEYVDKGNTFIRVNDSSESYIIDTKSMEKIKIKETIFNYLYIDNLAKKHANIIYSDINKKFYVGTNSKIYEFTWENYDKPKLLKDFGKLDIGMKFELYKGDQYILFEGGDYRIPFYDGYIFDIKNLKLTKIVEGIGKREGNNIYPVFSYNKEKNLFFLQLEDKKSSMIEPCIAELRNEQMFVKEKIFAPEQMKNEALNGYEARWNNGGNKLFMYISSCEIENKGSEFPIQKLSNDYRMINITGGR